MDIVKYMKSKASLEEREDKLFELINELDDDSRSLFDEVVNTNIESVYRLIELLNECKSITIRYKELYESYDYIKHIEEDSIFFASQRYQLKMMLATIASLYAFMSDAMLGIVSYVLLSRSAGLYFFKELDYINETLMMFDDDKFKAIKVEIDNSKRMINGKLRVIVNRAMQDKDLKDKITLENKYIYSSILGEEEMDYNKLPLDVQQGIVNILKDELKEDTNDINVLTNLLKEKEKDKMTLKLTKK